MTRRSGWGRLLLAGLLLALVAGAGTAGNAHQARRQAEASRVVEGTVTIGTDGSVLAHAITSKGLEPDLQAMLAGTVQRWRFDPVKVEGRAVAVKVPMRIRLVARPTRDQQSTIRIASTHFGIADPTPGAWPVVTTKATIQYPEVAARAGVGATAYVYVRIGRQGELLDLATRQVNLRVISDPRTMGLLRKAFAEAAESGVRQYTFTPATVGPAAEQREWVGSLTINFVLRGRAPGPDDWDTYVPGPPALIPWLDQAHLAGGEDAAPDDTFQALGSGPRLLNGDAG